MGVEVEKKYRLDSGEQAEVVRCLRESGAELHGEDFETNTIYGGNGIDPSRVVLRIRQTERKATLTYKERDYLAADATAPTLQGVRSQREDETQISDPAALTAILQALGYHPSLIYEKRRATWTLNDVEVVVDELPFGLFLEIEGAEEGIRKAEIALALTETESVAETYPELTARHGRRNGDTIEARFS
jgi:adenylate cyclase class 2